MIGSLERSMEVAVAVMVMGWCRWWWGEFGMVVVVMVVLELEVEELVVVKL